MVTVLAASGPMIAVRFQTSNRVLARSVYPTADVRRLHRHVGFVP
jgi:hypothetical protein